MLKSLTEKELKEVLEIIVEDPEHVKVLQESLKKFTIIQQEKEAPIHAVKLTTTPEHRTKNSRRNSLPANVSLWTIDPSRIEFTGEAGQSHSGEVGKGSTCKVYRGVYKKDTPEGGVVDYDVAVKIMDENVALGEDSEFAYEFEIQKNVRHVNIVRFFGLVIEENIALVMEFCGRLCL